MPESNNNSTPGMFTEPTPPRAFPTTAVTIASVAILLLVGFFILLAHRHAPPPAPTTIQPLASYAPNLAITNIQMSEAGTNTGGKSTYIDGHIANHGASTVTGITVQAIFSNDDAMPPQLETTQLYLIRSREPYIDTEPVSAEPLAPGGEADFRLIFENIYPSWNTQPPAIHITHVSTQ
jgi:hypothetical protein